MDRQRVGQLVFACAFLLALVVYGLTAPVGLPWNGSTHLALAHLGEIIRPPDLPHPIWGNYVRVFGGAVGLSVFLAALTAGLLAVLVSRHWGWRFSVAAVLVWIFLPAVWNRAITGERSICLVAMAVAAVWLGHVVFLCVFRKVDLVTELNAPAAHITQKKRSRVNRVAGWVALGVAALFALGSLTLHDFRLGEAASVFARGVVDEAGERWIVMNGVCDDQIVRAAGKRTVLSLRVDDVARTNFSAWVRHAFPAETNLWVAAAVSPATFVEKAIKDHPNAFYLMNGTSTSVNGWEVRWQAFQPYLNSDDPFVRVARRQFAFEANALGNRLAEEDGQLHAWRMYRRIFSEIDPGNLSALINLSEMIRRGYAASSEERQSVHLALEKFFSDEWNRRHLKDVVRAAGPVRSDPEVLSRVLTETKKRVAARVAAGEPVEVAPEILSLGEWNNEMVAAMDRAETEKAGRIARAILANPKWRGFVPANAVLGAISSGAGDYVTGERFFRAALSTTNSVPAAVLNDFADTLMNLRKLDEAEANARRAVAESSEKFWVARLTLAQVLASKMRTADDTESVSAELRQLVLKLMKTVPAPARQKVLELQRKVGIR